MLGDSPVAASIAVKDMEAAKSFYGETLGLAVQRENDAGVWYKSGPSEVLVYPSEYAGTNKATYAGWYVQDVDAVVEDLKSKGVPFMTFDMPGVTWSGEVASMGPMKSAWFTDPDGNILAIGNM